MVHPRINRMLGFFIPLLIVLTVSSGQVRGLEANADPLTLIPWPAQIESRSGELALSSATNLVIHPAKGIDPWLAGYLKQRIKERTGLSLAHESSVQADSTTLDIELSLSKPDQLIGKEGYYLEVDERVSIKAATEAGLFYGCQTLVQLIAKRSGSFVIPEVSITDYPRFSYRGMHFDPARNFLEIEFLYQMVDRISELKLNVMHIHLTDDQGWRIEIKRYPYLQQIGGAVGYYTQEQMRELIKYAGQRQVTIIPEIDIPGHVTALLASYPEYSCTGEPIQVSTRWGVHDNLLCPAKEEVYVFLDGLFEEIAELFPSEYIHIGSDEVPGGDWKECPKCQALAEREGLDGKEGLQAYFVARVDEILKKHGKKMIGWDEITGFAPEDTMVQAWRDIKYAREAAELGHKAIVSPTKHYYFDYAIWAFSLKNAYKLDPIPKGLDPELHHYIQGGEACMWGEFAPQEMVESKVYPRVLALSEATWSRQEDRKWKDFKKRVKQIKPILEGQGVDTSNF